MPLRPSMARPGRPMTRMPHLASMASRPSSVQRQRRSLHEGVICNGCEGAIEGLRYQCTTLDDTDLCGACHARLQGALRTPGAEFRIDRLPPLSAAPGTYAELEFKRLGVCPAKHSIECRPVSSTGIRCDDCDELIAAGGLAFSCGQCRFDRCVQCARVTPDLGALALGRQISPGEPGGSVPVAEDPLVSRILGGTTPASGAVPSGSSNPRVRRMPMPTSMAQAVPRMPWETSMSGRRLCGELPGTRMVYWQACRRSCRLLGSPASCVSVPQALAVLAVEQQLRRSHEYLSATAAYLAKGVTPPPQLDDQVQRRALAEAGLHEQLQPWYQEVVRGLPTETRALFFFLKANDDLFHPDVWPDRIHGGAADRSGTPLERLLPRKALLICSTGT
mmetsp:Transcript_57751/g.181029  ORF Transcript_57751/g.181029 Transcript_57751/m.181029 type:complete len:391 (+) Transcript_57751:2-1174(+)